MENEIGRSLMKENIIEVRSVSEFINSIEKHACKYWRGESKDFGDTRLTASGFRGTSKGVNGDGSPIISSQYFNREKVKRFYRETASRLTQNEKDNFLAFAQHHRINTPLLDITTNPLVALWMACENEFDEDGCIYGFDNNSDIQIDDFYNSESFGFAIDNPNSPDFCEQIQKFEERCSCYVMKNFKKIIFANLDSQQPSTFVNYRDKEIKTSGSVDIWFAGIMLYELDLDVDKDEDARLNKNCEKYLRICLEKILREESSFKAEMEDETFIRYFKELFVMYYPYSLRELTEKTAPLIPRMKYNPLMFFDRAEKQGSLFYYQYSPPSGSFVQKFVPNIIIKVKSNAKEQIINTLDSLNVNRGTIFIDFDNIAQYIKESQN